MASRQSETKDFDFGRSSVVGIFFALTEFPTRSHLFACWQCESPALNCALVARLLASPWKNLLSGPPRGLIYSDDRFRVFTSFPLSRRVHAILKRQALAAGLKPSNHRVASLSAAWATRHRRNACETKRRVRPAELSPQRTYTRADITRYSDAYRRGRISEADYAKLSADI